MCDHRVIAGVGVYRHYHGRVKIGPYHHEIERVLRPTLREIEVIEAGVGDVIAVVIITVPHDLRPRLDLGILVMGVLPRPYVDHDAFVRGAIDQVHLDVALAAQYAITVSRR